MFHEKNPWKKEKSKSFQKVAEKPSTSSDTLWRENGEDFPALGAAAHAPPVSNVWEERKAKQESVKALEPQNEYDEEAMLQQALALSMLEASKEEERRKEIEEQYKMQMEVLQNAPELLEEYSATDEFDVDGCSETKSDYDGNFNNDEKNYGKMFVKESASDFRQSEQSSNFKGARPKINSAIERFGGWGLKDTKPAKTEALSNFVDKIVYKESSNERKQNGKYDYQDEYENPDRSMKKSVPKTDIWSHSQGVEAVQGVNDKVALYNEEGTFVDAEEDSWNCSENYNEDDIKPVNISPSKVLDTWLDSEDAGECGNNTVIYQRQKSDTVITNDNLSRVSFSDKTESQDVKDSKSAFVESSMSVFCDNNVSKTVSSQSPEFSKSSKKWQFEVTDHEEQTVCPPPISSPQKFDGHEQNTNEFSLFQQSDKFTSLISEIWSESAPSSFSFTNESKLCSETHPISFASDLENGAISSESASNDTDLPPILPPKPGSAVLSEAANVCCKQEPPILPPNSTPEISVPQSPSINNPLLNPSAPEISVPQFPVFNNPLLNPLPPGLGFNPMAPMAGYCMDPLLMRQMLILHNPFLASQIFAMEQYYRSLGMPIDMFSSTNPMPQIPMPGLMNLPNLPLTQNVFADSLNMNLLPDSLSQLQTQLNANDSLLQLQTQINANDSLSQLQTQLNANDSLLQLQTQINANDSLSQLQTQFNANLVVSDSDRNTKLEQKSFPELSQMSQFDNMSGFSNSSSLFEKDSDSSWHKTLLASDSESVIPPPRPSSNIAHLDTTTELPKSRQSFDYTNNSNSISHLHNSNSCSLSQKKLDLGRSDESFSTVQASKPKTEATGWGDPDDDSFDIHRSKTSSWTDNWDEESVPAKSLRNPSRYEEKKITDLRQPTRPRNPRGRNYRGNS